MEKRPVDIWSLKEYGLDKWLNKFDWPVNHEEFKGLFDDVQQLYAEITTRFQGCKDIFLTDQLVADGLIYFLHSLAVVERYKSKGFDVVYSERSFYFPQILQDQTEVPLLRKPMPKIPTLQEKLRGLAAELKINGVEMGHGLRALKSSRQGTYMCFDLYGHSRDYPIKYAASNSKKLIFIHPRRLIPTIKQRKHPSSVVSQATAIFICELERIAENFGIKSFKKYAPWIQRDLERRQAKIESYLDGIKKTLAEIKPEKIIAQSLGALHTRMILLAAQKLGIETIGISHGNGGAHILNNYLTPYMLNVTDTYLASSIGFKSVLERSVKSFHSLYRHHVKVEFFQSQSKEIAPAKPSRRREKHGIKRVFFMETGITQARYFVPWFWPYQIEFNIRCSQLIQSVGVEVCLKRHPELLEESDGIYDTAFNSTIEAPFEQIYDNTDAYIFPFFGTSSFGFAVQTNKPIITFENSFDHIWKEEADLLRRRCIIIPSWYGVEGKLLFDEQKLKEALTKKHGEIDREYINRFYP